jgi:predicted Zn-dependent protease with MMP-like domain
MPDADTEAPDWQPILPPGIEDIERLARDAIAALPEAYREAARAVALRVEDFVPDDILEEMGLHDPFELSGLYEGTPLTEKSVMDQPQRPDVIWLFRRPILDEWAERGDVTLGELVAHVLVHELAHHFGWSDDDIAAIDPWWE